MDVVLNALFLDPSTFIKDAMSGVPNCVPPDNVCGTSNPEITRMIQSNIKDVAQKLSIHSTESTIHVSLDELRESAKSCPVLNSQERFDQKGMNDPSVFIEYLVGIFPCLKMAGESPLVYLHAEPLEQINGKDLSDVIDTHVETTKKPFDDPELVIFDITRLERGEYNENVNVFPNEKLDLSGTADTHLPAELSAVVVWKEFHYTVYVKVGESWYYLDDAKPYVEMVGTYENLLEHKDGFVSKDGKLFFYTC
jgi:hypothetical protein